ncbi:MAG: hypothetical protein A2041_03830 [Bacteroidetes bacterium GWA2_31_9b]|nr:MAG: hypothetical protein A2041_03830 [Bacteroidetes bacterium GWA2_31_9b]
MLNRRLKEYFSFTQKERYGIIVLISIVLIVMIFRYLLLNQSYSEPIFENNEELISEVQTFEKSLSLKNSDSKYRYQEKSTNKEWIEPDILFNFDPNLSSIEDLLKLGFSQSQANTIMNYRNKGGKFSKKEDLLKIYGVTKEQYNVLQNYILINNKEYYNNTFKNKDYNSPKVLNIELNSASDSELVALSGVGESFAKRILKYRTRLGGFVYKEQLFEVYGMDTTRYNLFINQISIDTSLLLKMNLNTIEYKDLIKHPYLNKYQVQAILKCRELNGDFKSIEELVINNLISKEVYKKIKPYIDIK